METCTWIELTSEEEWEPNSNRFKEQEHIAQENQNHTYEAPEREIYAKNPISYKHCSYPYPMNKWMTLHHRIIQ
jgi:hypothetical protein